MRRGFSLSEYLFSLSFSLNAAGTGFDALAVENRVLQIRQKPYYRRPHGVGSFYGAGIGLTANCAHPWHGFI